MDSGRCQYTTLSLPESVNKDILTSESVDEILWCDHSNETLSAVLSHGTIITLHHWYYWYLTSYRRHIVDKAFQMKKTKIFTSVWTLDGKIFVKCSPDDRPIRILSEEDLEDFR